MIPKRVVSVLNVSLGLIALLLLLRLADVSLPSVGQVIDRFTPGEPFCAVQWGETTTSLPDLGWCCLEARKQLACYQEGEHWVCQTGQGKVLKYLLNEKAYHYCQQQVIWR